MTRDYLTVKVWDLNMESRPIETYQVQTTPTHGCIAHFLCGLPSQPLPAKACYNTEKPKWYSLWGPLGLRQGHIRRSWNLTLIS